MVNACSHAAPHGAARELEHSRANRRSPSNHAISEIKFMLTISFALSKLILSVKTKRQSIVHFPMDLFGVIFPLF